MVGVRCTDGAFDRHACEVAGQEMLGVVDDVHVGSVVCVEDRHDQGQAADYHGQAASNGREQDGGARKECETGDECAETEYDMHVGSVAVFRMPGVDNAVHVGVGSLERLVILVFHMFGPRVYRRELLLLLDRKLLWIRLLDHPSLDRNWLGRLCCCCSCCCRQ